MTRVNNGEVLFLYKPAKKPVDSPLMGKLTEGKIPTIQDIWHNLSLKGGSEVEVRFLHQDGSPAYYIGNEKTNYVVMRYVLEKFPDIPVTFESSASMIEFDTGLCTSYEMLIEKLERIQLIKEDILKTFDLIAGPAHVEDRELMYEFVNPIHHAVMSMYEQLHKNKEHLYDFLTNLSDTDKCGYGLDLTTPERIQYILTVQEKLPPEMLKYTQTTAQQLTLSTSDFATTLRLDQQLLNYITSIYYGQNKSYRPRTTHRGEQWRKVVTYRADHKIGITGGYDPIAPGSKYIAYIKKTYFDNGEIDRYTLGHVSSSMSHGPVSLKFSVNNEGDLVPRTEFRIQDALTDTRDAQYQIDEMLMGFIHSVYAKYPMYPYERLKKN